jgi:hypothetical protein
MKKVLVFVLAVLVGSCASKGPSQEQAQIAADKGKEFAALRDSGKITWKRWAQEANQLIRNTFPNLSLRMQASLQYREAVAAEVDSGKTTKETALYLISQKFADSQSEDERDRNMRRASARSAPDTIVCNRIVNTTICN